MYDPAVPEELDSTEQDLPPEVEVFFEPPAQPPDTEFLGDVTQLYLNEIGANPLAAVAERAMCRYMAKQSDAMLAGIDERIGRFAGTGKRLLKEEVDEEDIAEVVEFIVTRRRRVAVNEVLIRPTEQPVEKRLRATSRSRSIRKVTM